MKYGLLYYKDTDNIGDDIQTYAASQFLPRVDYLIDRERLEEFIPQKKEEIKVIMNAWYIHDKFNFDISPYITPLYISVFLKRFPYESGITVGTDYINDNIKNSFLNYGPVGTRDLHTKEILQKLNIPSYFSGCMTLTINKLPNIKKKEYILVNGLTDDEIEYIKNKTNREIVSFTQKVEKGSLANEDWKTRKQRVENTLKLYQEAHMVITTKLHCCLPCLALETPVLLLFDKSFKENIDRIGTYLPYVNYINRNELLTTNLNLENPLKNPKNYIKLKNELERKCRQFIENKNNKIELPKLNDYKEYLIKSKNMRSLPIRLLEELQSKYEKECMKASKKQDEYESLLNDYNNLKKEYFNIVNSKGYKFLTKIWNIKNRRKRK